VVTVYEPLHIDDAVGLVDNLEPYITRVRNKVPTAEATSLSKRLALGIITLHPIGDEGFFIASWGDDECFVIFATSFELSCTDLSAFISATALYAKQHNCSKLSFRSQRKAWRKIAPLSGFSEVKPDYFTLELNDVGR